MKTLFVAPYSPSSVDAVKLAALYFDEVVINERALIEIKRESVHGRQSVADGEVVVVKGRCEAITSTVDDRLREGLRPLIEEKVVRIDPEPVIPLLRGTPRARLRKEFGQTYDLLYEQSPGKNAKTRVGFLEKGMEEIHGRFVGPLMQGAPFDGEMVSTYFEGLFVEAIGAALRGEAVVSSSPALYRIVERAIKSPSLQSPRLTEAFANYVQPRLAMDVLRAAVVDTSKLECDVILDVRYELRDELTAFRQELQRLQFDFTKEFGIEKIYTEGRAIADARLSKPIRDIEGKIKSSRIRALRRIVEHLEKPDAYVPVLGSMFVGMPLSLALMLSLGLISSRVALEAWEEHQEIANEGLFYLVKLKSLLSTRARQLPQPGARTSVTFQRRRPNTRNSRKRVFKWPEDTLVASEKCDEHYALKVFRAMREIPESADKLLGSPPQSHP